MASEQSQQILMYKIAHAYYEDGMTQQDIGKRFGLSRIKVGRLLKQAQHEKIVRIILREPQNSDEIELEHCIQEKYKVDEVILVPAIDDNQRVLQKIGIATAIYLNRTLHGDEVIGLTWGGSVLAVVNALPNKNWPDMKVVQLLGGLGSPEADMYGTQLTVRAAQSFGAKPRLISAPGILPTEELCEALSKDHQVADTLKLGSKADVAIAGLGRPTQTSPIIRAGILTTDELDDLNRLGAVGDIGLRFINAEGQPINHELDRRIIGLTLEQYQTIPKLIGVAGGPDKFEIVRAALLGKYINVLITDLEIGKRLLV